MLRSWLAYQAYYRDIPGISVGIVHGNDVLFAAGFGYADVTKKKPATSRTVYQIASISKIFTATAILQLVEQKRIDLDKPVSLYLSWFKSKKDPKISRITIRQLLTHTGGIARDGRTPYWIHDRYPSERGLRAEFLNGVTFYKPNSHFKYSNLGPSVLAALIASVAGASYRTYIHNHILDPLSMEHTDIQITSRIREVHARGYGRSEPGVARKAFTKIADAKALAGATGFSSNVTDLSRFLSAHFLGNRAILTDRSKREMQQTQWKEPDGYKMGLGFEHWKRGKLNTIGHSGGFAGFTSRIELHQPSKIGLVVLTNVINGPSKSLANGIFSILSHYSKRSARPAKHLLPYEGIYESRWGDEAITPLGNKLINYDPYSLEPLSHAAELSLLSGREFKITKDAAHAFRNETARFTPTHGKPRMFYVAAFPYRRKKIPIPHRT